MSKSRLVKVREEKVLLLLLTSIKASEKPSDIAKVIGFSKQRLNGHLNRLRKNGLIRRVQSYPSAIYRLTDLGERVNANLRQSETLTKSLWRVHNLIVGFDIKSFGTYRFIDTSKRKVIPMNNWSYAREDVDDFVVNVQDTGLFKIYCPEKYTTEPDRDIGQLYSRATQIAQSYCDRFEMKMGQMKIIRQCHKELQKSEKLAKLFKGYKIKGMWEDASTGTSNLEEDQNSQEIENLLRMPKIIDEQLVPTLEALTEQIQLHLSVMQEMKETLREIREWVKK